MATTTQNNARKHIVDIHIKKPEKAARYGSQLPENRKAAKRNKDGKFRSLTNRERMERGLRQKRTRYFYVLHDENEDSRKRRMRKENLVALVALVKHHPDRVPVWLREFIAAGGPKGPAGA